MPVSANSGSRFAADTEDAHNLRLGL